MRAGRRLHSSFATIGCTFTRTSNCPGNWGVAMYEAHWGFTESPFRNSIDIRWFHPSVIHDEALARLFFLVEQQRRFGLLQGAVGTGKSMLLAVLHDEAKGSHRQTAAIDLLGMDSAELLWTLAARLQLAPETTASGWQLWRAIEEYFHALALSQMPAVVLLDNLDQSADDLIPSIERLIRVADQVGAKLTIIAATRRDEIRSASRSLAELSELRVDLTPLDAYATELYIRDQLVKADSESQIFDPSAIEAVFRHSDGFPREINRLCELSLLAAMGEGLQTIDAGIIESVALELRDRFPRSRSLVPLEELA